MLEKDFSCCWYHKGTNFQANHNANLTTLVHLQLLLIPQRYEFSSKSQLTEKSPIFVKSCCWYHKGTNFQANHNKMAIYKNTGTVVADTTKVRIFKQITTYLMIRDLLMMLLLIPQRYEFSSKSQLIWAVCLLPRCCCWYHKGTNFQANHNLVCLMVHFKVLLLIPQRYEFSSKSQLVCRQFMLTPRCCWYHKGTNFQANHNETFQSLCLLHVVADTTKVRIFKQITTRLQEQTYDTIVVADTTKVRIFKQITTTQVNHMYGRQLLLIPQRYEFSSKSQQLWLVRNSR